MNYLYYTRLIVLVIALGLGWGGQVQAEPQVEPNSNPWLRSELKKLVDAGGVAVGASRNSDKQFIYGDGTYVPASILKLATGYCALKEFGEGYRFQTRLYLHEGWLYVSGSGDPHLVSEAWHALGDKLKRKGIFKKPLAGLVVDGSAFQVAQVNGQGRSLNPYDAGLGALASNFNTIFVEVDAKGRLSTAEEQTPLTALGRELSSGFKVGFHRFNITAKDDWSLRYSAELAIAIWAKAGANFVQGWRVGKVPAQASLIHVHYSIKEMRETISDMLKYSNNFIANQLVLAVADKRAGRPASLAKGMVYMRACLAKEGFDESKLQWVEGSGLSRDNRVQLRAMLEIMELFYDWRHLLPQYGKPPWQALAKTGTLNGVYNLAGFLPASPKHVRPFVIMLNQARHNREAVFRLLIQNQSLP